MGLVRRGGERRRSAFTLIELLVVIVILAALMAIAIPTFLNQRDKARDVSAKSDITNAYKGMKSEWTDEQRYRTSQIATVSDDERALRILAATGSPYLVGQTQVNVASEDVVIVTARSRSGRDFCLVAREQGDGTPVVGVHRSWQDAPDAATAASWGCPSSATLAVAGDGTPSGPSTPPAGPAPTTLVYTGATSFASGVNETFSGTLTGGASPLSGMDVVFTIGTGPTAQSCTGTTNGSGQASCTVALAQAPGALTLASAYAGDGTHAAASDSDSVVVTSPSFGDYYAVRSGLSPAYTCTLNESGSSYVNVGCGGTIRDNATQFSLSQPGALYRTVGGVRSQYPTSTNSSVAFNGASHYSEVGQSFEIAGSGGNGKQWSAEVWVSYTGTIGSTRGILGYDNRYGFDITPTGFRAQVQSNGGSPPVNATVSHAPNTWYHLVMTWSPTSTSSPSGGVLTLYVNGVSRGTTAYAQQLYTGGSTTKLGYDPTWANSTWFAGSIDELSLYNGTLSPAQVRGLYEAGCQCSA